jgi:hypothetical protein
MVAQMETLEGAERLASRRFAAVRLLLCAGRAEVREAAPGVLGRFGRVCALTGYLVVHESSSFPPIGRTLPRVRPPLGP